MIYVGAFVTHGNDAELCLIIGKDSVGARVRICKWSNGIVRTAKEENVSVIPALEGVERLRTLIVSATPKGNHDVLDGKEDLVAAAYAYIACHGSGSYTAHLARRSIQGNDGFGSTVTPPSIKGRRQKQPLGQFHSTSPPHTQPSLLSKILPHEEDFIREGVITEMVATNLALTKTGHIDVLGTKVDLCRLIQIYCATAGVSAPTKSLMLRRIREITSFLSNENPGQTVFTTPRGLMFDIKEMEP
ncbi:hypothetical protein [Pseudomonas savastanoi]|uniref:Uncharacterized protein n=3 Tax=Pseudomonas savastanoi TaxID=29438 RepID=A0A3M3VIM7_PSESG|nr:hypothetical protein [Pseudomonas savastanoi]EFW80278.1 hypothetical protein PsgB076_13532 [Pseudomonas savastanoi pv. glycinea str. B076]EFW84641.1 hypothetical protein PsgRace4_18078 [Pseudomonas savastanoi pv. glycinea str. race 4]EGH16501.1 hypothetical protein Pgy4_25975 [Pseudomonas savastanoi pv. glycinea str. race 4]MCQ3007607.1 hypothetical protein [Pseudomonas savastanoi]PYD20098.1 hypothetical protein DND36_25545 [Pseudomonas savastanoi pv. glycinea]